MSHREDAEVQDHPTCPMCGKTKRGFRRQYDQECAECERRTERYEKADDVGDGRMSRWEDEGLAH